MNLTAIPGIALQLSVMSAISMFLRSVLITVSVIAASSQMDNEWSCNMQGSKGATVKVNDSYVSDGGQEPNLSHFEDTDESEFRVLHNFLKEMHTLNELCAYEKEDIFRLKLQQNLSPFNINNILLTANLPELVTGLRQTHCFVREMIEMIVAPSSKDATLGSPRFTSIVNAACY
jgi:hypothetical protein